jgi:hypothetical protein
MLYGQTIDLIGRKYFIERITRKNRQAQAQTQALQWGKMHLTL